MMLHVGSSELTKAFKLHYQTYQQCFKQNPQLDQNRAASYYLLLFYAAESGIKAIWLKRNKIHTTAKIPDQNLLSKKGHNLGIWIKKLKISAQEIGNVPNFRLDRDKSSWNIEKVHQAWRYGIKIEPQDEQALVIWLEKLCNWINNNL